MRTIYTAEAHVSGGRVNGRGRTADGRLDLVLRPPVELGGSGEGTNPEQLLAIGWAACFEATLGTAAHLNNMSMKTVADAEIDSRVMLMLPAAEAGPADFQLGVEFDVRLPSIDDAAVAAELVRKAHQMCPYSKATLGNIDLRLTVNGRPLG
ncbi:MAG TPA: Ohr family peroxiredoxin [Mycobacterium sp.]|nr:Ohr family peroxiredoxin [Mycobacterium sp.]